MLKKYPCPVCDKRACDSNKTLMLSKLSKSNSEKADIVIKCKNCKSSLAVNVIRGGSDDSVCMLPDKG